MDLLRMNETDLEKAINQIGEKLEKIAAELTRLGSNQGLPTDRVARDDLAQSHQKLREKLTEERDEFEKELTRRRENGA